MEYDLLITAVTHRGDLFEDTVDSFLSRVDQEPSRILVHEDYRPPSERKEGTVADKGRIDNYLSKLGIPYNHRIRDPWIGMGYGVDWLLKETDKKYTFYCQEDFEFLQDIPITRCLELIDKFDLNHIRFNKTGNHHKHANGYEFIEYEFDGQKMQASQHWHFQATLWRTDLAREIADILAKRHEDGLDWYARLFNDVLNKEMLNLNTDMADPKERAEKAKTFVWGPTGTPAFIRHTGKFVQSQDEAKTRTWKRRDE